MSADNYYDIAQNPVDNRWYVYMGFMSNEEIAQPRKNGISFETEYEAITYGFDDWTEYGCGTVDWPGFIEDTIEKEIDE